MKIIELDAEKWTTLHDFYNALLACIGAPKWHGMSIDALIDSMIWGGINAVEPPYTIRIRNVGQLPKDVLNAVELAKSALAEGRADFNRREGHDVEVQLELVP